MSDTQATAEFVITRHFAAPRERVWDAWTKPDQIARWFGPKGTQTEVLEFDLRPGGRLHSHMITPEGEMWGRFVYQEVSPPERLVWLHSFADAAGEIAPSPFGGPWPRALLTVVEFEEADGGTRITLRWSPHEAAPDEVAAFVAMMDSMNDGWGGSFDQLDAFLAESA